MEISLCLKPSEKSARKFLYKDVLFIFREYVKYSFLPIPNQRLVLNFVKLFVNFISLITNLKNSFG